VYSTQYSTLVASLPSPNNLPTRLSVQASRASPEGPLGDWPELAGCQSFNVLTGLVRLPALPIMVPVSLLLRPINERRRV
jgi:hypothetical protein